MLTSSKLGCASEKMQINLLFFARLALTLTMSKLGCASEKMQINLFFSLGLH